MSDCLRSACQTSGGLSTRLWKEWSGTLSCALHHSLSGCPHAVAERQQPANNSYPFLLQMGRQDTLLPSSGGLRSEAVQSPLLNKFHALITITFHEAGAVKTQSSAC